MHQIDQEDVDAIAAILESEKASHTRTRGLCFGLFLLCLGLLIVALGVIAFLLGTGRMEDAVAGDWLSAMQLLTPLSAAAVGFFGSWWTAQNCINSIDRTIFAARAGRHRLFTSFLGQLQCADKKKRKMWQDMLTSLVS